MSPRAATAARPPAPERPVPPAPDADDVILALDRLAAGLWLLDAVQYGELSFLFRKREKTVAWWRPWPFPMRPADLKAWLEDMALKYTVEALHESYGELRKLTRRLAEPPGERQA